MKITFYPDDDAMYVQLKDSVAAYGMELDDKRHLDFDAADALVGISFLDVSEGVELDGIICDEIQEISDALRKPPIKALA